MVLFDVDDKYVIAHPKYDIRKKVTRISNPVDPNRNNELEILGAVKFGCKDYMICKEDIMEYFPCFGIINDICSGTKESFATRQATLDLIDIISKAIPKEYIGITGSLATGKAIDGYSDIDLVLREKDYRALIESNVFSNSEIQFRDKKQWIDFYNHYGVCTILTAEEFATAAEDKKQQFLFRGIPVSIFIEETGNFLQITNSMARNEIHTSEILKGKVICENLIELPGYAFIEHMNKVIVVVNMHRTYQNSLYVGDYCVVKARRSSFLDLFLVDYDNICYIKKCSGGNSYDK